jgi:hypothetical protein
MAAESLRICWLGQHRRRMGQRRPGRGTTTDKALCVAPNAMSGDYQGPLQSQQGLCRGLLEDPERYGQQPLTSFDRTLKTLAR